MEDSMDPDQFVQKINERDARIRVLTEYAKQLEFLLAERRGEDAKETAHRAAFDEEIASLRYEHGLRVDLTPR